MDAPIRILIVDDHEVVRKGIRLILNDERPSWEICGEANNGREAIDAAARLKPDIILLDITMPVMSGLEAASHISGSGEAGPILFFTMHESGELASEAKRVGAKGYVRKSDAARHLVKAIEALLSGATFFGQPGKVPNEGHGSPSPGIQFRLALGLC
ncbi:MAG TPA: response regulator transcription factor [Verrucomicrobiae bacterium]|nr:response regulator transcription factor [Verrucomicrobiae bacterium]